MHPLSDLVAGRGQLQTNGTTPVLAPRGILVRRDDPFRSPRAVESRVRLNMRTYVADALEGGDWRNRANYVQDEHWDMASAVAILQRREDRPVLYPRRNDAVELIQLCENTRANAGLLAQPADRGVTASALAEEGYRDLEVVDCEDDYSPVRGDLPESLAVTEEWLRLRGRGKSTRTAIYDTATESLIVYDELIAIVSEMMEPGTTGFEDARKDGLVPFPTIEEKEIAARDALRLSASIEDAYRDMTVPFQTTEFEDDYILEVDELGFWNLPASDGMFEPVGVTEVAEPRETYRKSVKGTARRRMSRRLRALDSVLGQTRPAAGVEHLKTAWKKVARCVKGSQRPANE